MPYRKRLIGIRGFLKSRRYKKMPLDLQHRCEHPRVRHAPSDDLFGDHLLSLKNSQNYFSYSCKTGAIRYRNSIDIYLVFHVNADEAVPHDTVFYKEREDL